MLARLRCFIVPISLEISLLKHLYFFDLFMSPHKFCPIKELFEIPTADLFLPWKYLHNSLFEIHKFFCSYHTGQDRSGRRASCRSRPWPGRWGWAVSRTPDSRGPCRRAGRSSRPVWRSPRPMTRMSLRLKGWKKKDGKRTMRIGTITIIFWSSWCLWKVKKWSALF